MTLTTKEIIKMVADHHGIKAQDILAKGRTRRFSDPRQEAMYVCRKAFDCHTYESLGAEFGGRDHSTIHHGVQAVSERASRCHETETRLKSWIAQARPAPLVFNSSPLMFRSVRGVSQ